MNNNSFEEVMPSIDIRQYNLRHLAGNDMRLSPKAVDVLTMLLPVQTISEKFYINVIGGSRYSVHKYFHELRHYGYLKKIIFRNKDGQYTKAPKWKATFPKCISDRKHYDKSNIFFHGSDYIQMPSNAIKKLTPMSYYVLGLLLIALIIIHAILYLLMI